MKNEEKRGGRKEGKKEGRKERRGQERKKEREARKERKTKNGGMRRKIKRTKKASVLRRISSFHTEGQLMCKSARGERESGVRLSGSYSPVSVGSTESNRY